MSIRRAPWTLEEDAYLRRHHREKSVRELAQVLGRTRAAVSTRMSALCLCAPRGGREPAWAFASIRAWERSLRGPAQEGRRASPLV